MNRWRELAVAFALFFAPALAFAGDLPIVEATRDATARHLAVSGAIALFLRQIMEALQRLGPVEQFKRWFPLVLAALGLGATFFTHYAMGSGWLDAAIVGIGGPSAVLVNEVVNMLRAAPKPGLELPPPAAPPPPKRAA